MAHVTPAAVHEGTQTSGLSDYTLTGSPETDRRTLAQAVTEGDASNGDTVSYMVTSGGTGANFEFEYGTGTISSGGAAVSRDTIHQSSNGGSKVSWPPGGTRAFIVTTSDWALVANNGSDYTAATFATNLGLPRLSASNTYTDRQRIKRAGVTGLLDVGSDLSAGVVGRIDLFGHDSGGENEVYVRIAGQVVDATAGSEDGQMAVFLPLAGVMTEHLRLTATSGLTEQPSGNKFVAFPAGGAVEMIFGTAPPLQWTRLNETTNQVPMFATSGDTAGATGGSWTVSGLSVSGTVAGHTLTVAEIPGHTHDINTLSSTGGSGVAVKRTDDGVFQQTDTTVSTGGGSSHAHGWSGSVSSNGNWRPLNRIVVRATFDG